MRNTKAALAALVGALLVAACAPTSSPSPAASNTMPSSSASHPVSSAPASPSPSPTAALDVQLIPQAWTTPMLAASTDGTEIIWSKGGDTDHGAPDLYGYIPGASAPTLLYRNPERAAQVMPIAVHHGKYAFEETWVHADGIGGWRVWYIAAAGQKAILLDSSIKDLQDLPAPAVWLALTDDRLIWNAVHQTPTGPHYYLRSYEFMTGVTRNLADADASKTEYWFPDADDSGRLVYSTVEYSSADGSTTKSTFHVYFAQVGDGPLQPRRLDTLGNATEPVLSGDTVIWKSVSGNPWDPGPIVLHSLSTGGTSADISFQSASDYQTAGNRFVAAWLDDHTVFEIYDLQTATFLTIEQHEPTSPHGAGRAAVAGDLLAFMRWVDEPGADLQLCWTRLPPRS